MQRLQTKLRHVDIHHLWLRQEVERDVFHVGYVPSNEMFADGLTKALSRQAHGLFIRQIGLADVTEERIRIEEEMEG
jgi:hypothetical protein